MLCKDGGLNGQLQPMLHSESQDQLLHPWAHPAHKQRDITFASVLENVVKFITLQCFQE